MADTGAAAQGTPPLTLGTAGHIDHGKTTLIEALTGTNADRLAEERRRGISIELGFTEMSLPSGGAVSVIDVPGHERFVRTMVAGATGIDVFLMVVAADDGVMPQTREHRAVLEALGVERGVIALTKSDVANRDRRRRVAAEVHQLIGSEPLVQVSSKTGEGLGELRDAIARVASEVAAVDRERSRWPFLDALLHVDRVFSLRGVGTVVTGTLWSGKLRRGDRVEILPGRETARVRSLQVHDRELELAAAGQRVALNLAGIKRGAISRGDVVTVSGRGLRASFRLDVELRLEHRAGDLGGERVQVHHGTRETAARVYLLDEGARFAQLRLEAPLIARASDRLVIRSIAPPDTLGGGVVVDPRPSRHGPGQAAERLRLMSEGDPRDILEAALEEGGIDLADDPVEWSCLPLIGPALHRFGAARWHEAVEGMVDAERTVASRGGSLTSAVTHNPRGSLAEKDRRQPPSATAMRALSLLEHDGLEPRSIQALADALAVDREEMVAALAALVQAEHIVRVTAALYYTSEALERLRRQILQLIHDHGSITIAELRDALGTSRKYAQGLLEHLDGRRDTVRRGDRHVLARVSGERRDGDAGGITLASGRQGSGGPTGPQSR